MTVQGCRVCENGKGGLLADHCGLAVQSEVTPVITSHNCGPGCEHIMVTRFLQLPGSFPLPDHIKQASGNRRKSRSQGGRCHPTQCLSLPWICSTGVHSCLPHPQQHLGHNRKSSVGVSLCPAARLSSLVEGEFLSSRSDRLSRISRNRSVAHCLPISFLFPKSTKQGTRGRRSRASLELVC